MYVIKEVDITHLVAKSSEQVIQSTVIRIQANSFVNVFFEDKPIQDFFLCTQKISFTSYRDCKPLVRISIVIIQLQRFISRGESWESNIKNN